MSVLRVCAAALAASITTMLACAPAGVHAAVLQVRAGESIAAAVGRAHPGDTVQVMGGTYKERILIDKPLRLEGIGKPTIAAGYQGDVIRVKSPDVSIRGLIVRDSGTDLGSQNAGIYVMPGSDRIVMPTATWSPTCSASGSNNPATPSCKATWSPAAAT